MWNLCNSVLVKGKEMQSGSKIEMAALTKITRFFQRPDFT